MEIKKNITDNDGDHLGTVVDVVKADEPAITLELDDGTIIKIRNTITEVVRYYKDDSDANPYYYFEGSLNVKTYPPDNN